MQRMVRSRSRCESRRFALDLHEHMVMHHFVESLIPTNPEVYFLTIHKATPMIRRQSHLDPLHRYHSKSFSVYEIGRCYL